MEKREEKKASAGHERDKLIESYNAQPTIEQQFESSSIVSRFISLIQVNSGEFNLFLQMGHIISSTFFLWNPVSDLRIPNKTWHLVLARYYETFINALNYVKKKETTSTPSSGYF